MLYLIGIVITFFLALLLIGKHGKTWADYLLTVWLILIGVHLGLFYLVISGNYLRSPALLGIEIPLPLAYGPMLYLYTSELTRQGPASRYRMIHFLPVLLAYLYILPFYILPNVQKIWVYQHEGEGFQKRQIPLLAAIILSGTLYALFAFIRLQKHRKSIAEHFSNTDRINLRWLSSLILGMTLIWVSVFLGEEKYIFTTVVGFVFFIGYFGIRQTWIFRDQPVTSLHTNAAEVLEPMIIEEVNAEIPVRQNKYAKSGLNQEAALLIHQELQTLMQKERLFADPELTLVSLSDKLNTNTNHLSQVINAVENRSFYDYINALRTTEFIKISSITENQKYTLLHLALECGFNSKTSFNRNFKKHTGLSPSDFLARRDIHLN